MTIRTSTSRFHRSTLAAALASAFAATPAHALDVFWLGGSGSWSTNSAWSSGAAPDLSTLDVFIDGGNALASTVTLNASASIGKLSISAGDALTVGNGGLLTLGGGSVVNSGTLTMAGTNATTRFALAADTTFSGSGQTVIGNSANNHLYGAHTLTIASGHTLRGGGQVGSTSYGALTAVVNRGTLRADAASGMSVYAGSVDNTQGTVQVVTSLSLYSGTLTGGSVQSTGSGVLSGGGTFSQVALSGGFTLAGGTFANATFNNANSIANGSIVGLSGTLTNSGTLTMAGTNATTRLALAADTTLAGSGQTVIGDSGNNHLYGDYTLTIGSGHTLRGGGQVGSASYGALAGIVNQGTLRADVAGGMSVYAGGVNNTNGLVQVADGSFITLQGGSLYGGTVNGAGSAYMTGSGVYRDTTLTGTLKVNNGDTLNVAGTLTNNGTFTLAGSNATTRLLLTGDTTLAGSGQSVIGNSANNHLYGSHTLTIASGHTLRGGGQVGSTSYGALTAVVNQGTLRADAASGMSVYAGSLDNRTGTLDVAGNSTLNVSGSLLLGDASLLKIDVNGLQQGTQYGLLRLASSATFDGIVNLDLADYAAHVGDSFTFLTLTGGATGSGSFDAVTASGYTLGVTYFSDHVTATVTAITAVPEPQSQALLLAGLGVLGWLARRRAAAR